MPCPSAINLSCATGGVGNPFSLGNPHVGSLSLHYIWRSGLSRSGMLRGRPIIT